MLKLEFNLPIPKVDLNKINIGHIVLISAIMRVFIMGFPNDGGMIFDEVHYIKATRFMMQGVAANAEHPPLTKIIGMISMSIFGDHWFGWRIPMVISSLISTYVVYLIAKEFMEDKLALLAAGFLIFDIVFFIQGNIYVLEIPALTFGLLFILYYLRGNYMVSATMMGLSFLCNEKALFLLLGMAIYHMLTKFSINLSTIDIRKTSTFLCICIFVGAGGLWVSDMVWRPSKATHVNVNIQHMVVVDDVGDPVQTITSTQTETQQSYINDPISHVIWMANYYGGINEVLVTPEQNFRPPWSWIAPLGNWDNPSVYFATIECGENCFYPINYRSQTPIFIWFMTLPILGLCLINFADKQSKFILSWVAGTYAPWFIWELKKMNMPFNHYFLFTIPVVVLGIPWFWSKLSGKYKYPIILGHLLICAVYFFMYFPVGVVRL